MVEVVVPAVVHLAAVAAYSEEDENMAKPMPRFEIGDTRQFTVAYSSAPTSTPYLAIYCGSGDGTLCSSQTGATSSTTAFYAFYTLPSSRVTYYYTWIASFSGSGPKMLAGQFQAIKSVG